MKVFFRRIHLYMGLVTGLVILITCFTGAILVFEEELLHLFNKERYYVQRGGQRQTLDDLITAVQKKVPGVQIAGVRVYTDETRNVELNYTVKRKEAGKAKLSGVEKRPRENPRLTAFVNPYTAQVIELYNYRDTFFYSVMSLHRWLLGGAAGKLITGISTLVFLFIIITGIVLWWPATKNILVQRLKLKWKGGWKRLNHDLHIVLGFYSCIVLFIFAFTALAWSFEWFNKGIYSVTKSPMQPYKAPLVANKPDQSAISFDDVLLLASNSIADAEYYNISAPKDSLSAYVIGVLSTKAVHETATDTYYADRYRPIIIASQKFSERNLGQRVRSTFKPVHTSAIFGLPSKIIGFIACLLGASFPVTGTIMWLNRMRKKRKNRAGVTKEEIVVA
jgi:uncharacterized iron-regulated membrane protein